MVSISQAETYSCMKTIKSVVLVIASLTSGGAERVISNLANYLARKGYQVAIVTYYPKKLDWYPLEVTIKRIVIGHCPSRTKPELIVNLFKRIIKLRKTIADINPNAIVSFLTEVNVVTILSTIGLRKKIIVSERVDPTMHQAILPFWKCLRRLTYPLANKLVVQTESIADYYRQWSGVNIAVIPNLAPSLVKSDVAELNFKKPFIVAIGRLVSQKGFDLLIKSFAPNAGKYPDWTLVIVGEGEGRQELLKLVRRFGLAKRIIMPGRVKNTQAVLRHSDLFVLSSRYEGFPNVLLEAMACGLPVVSFNCPSGPAEIIRPNYDGILTPPENIKRLSLAMDKLMGDKLLRQRLAKNARQVRTRFSEKKIMGRWEKLIG